MAPALTLNGPAAESEAKVFWLDSPDAPATLAPLEGEQSCDLAVVGGGFTGLWAALLAAPGEEVVLLEGERCGGAASGRNGCFLDASLTHGDDNGRSRRPGEMDLPVCLGHENFAAIRDTLAARGIDAGWEELVTEPLSPQQRSAIGWQRRQGLADCGNRFHYYRLTGDGRILWGGYEAVYHYRNGMRPELEESAAVFNLLAHNFAETFPQLEGLRFSHRWAGAIDTCSRFCVTFGQALGGRAAYAVGYTGLGVGASRFGARVALDLVHGRDTELTRLELVQSRPLPFPPEPIRYGVVQATRRALIRADERGGRRGPWLGLLDRLGAGFDS